MMLPPVKDFISLWAIWTVLACKWCLICADFSPDSDQTMLSLEEVLLWIMDSYFSRKQWFEVKTSLWWIYFFQTHSFCLLQMLTDGLEWCGLLWCFYQLFGLSFWRHPFTAKHLLMRHRCDAILQIWWRNKLLYISWGHFQLNLI